MSSFNKNGMHFNQVAPIQTRREALGTATSTATNLIVNIFGYLLLFLLVVVLIRTLAGVGNGSITFTSFLQWLSTFEPITINWSIGLIDLGQDWGIFNFLMPIFNGIIGLLNFGITLTSMLLSAISFIFGIVKWIFLI